MQRTCRKNNQFCTKPLAQTSVLSPAQSIETILHHPDVPAAEDPHVYQQMMELQCRPAPFPTVGQRPGIEVAVPHRLRDATKYGHEGQLDLSI